VSPLEYFDLCMTGNQLVGIDDTLCEQGDWMNGHVDEYGCDAIMCPIGYYAPEGRQTSDEDVCLPCDSESLGWKYMGARDCGNEQMTILRGLYDEMGGEGWDMEDDWMEERYECLWTGIECDENNDVIAIRLAGYGLTGRPPVELFHLPQLRVLDLSDNFIEFLFRGIGAAENCVG